MNRREFLKALGIFAVLTQFPIGEIKAYPSFDPSNQYGDFVEVTDFIDKELLIVIQSMFCEQIQKNIPPQYRENIKWIVFQPRHRSEDPLMQVGSVGWKYSPNKK